MRERPLVADLVKDTFVPKMFRVRQKFPRPRIDPADIPDIIRSLLSEEKFASRVKPGMRIAITAGSRGVANVALTTKCIADFVKSRGAHPFIVPAMGSHGGATAEGQREILAGYGIVEEYVGCPIISSMEVKKIGVNDEGGDVYIDKNAAEADGIIPVSYTHLDVYKRQVDEETFELAQKRIATRHRPTKAAEIDIFSGLQQTPTSPDTRANPCAAWAAPCS